MPAVVCLAARHFLEGQRLGALQSRWDVIRWWFHLANSGHLVTPFVPPLSQEGSDPVYNPFHCPVLMVFWLRSQEDHDHHDLRLTILSSPLCQMWCPTSQAMFAFLTFSIVTYHYLSSDPSWPSGKKCSHNGHVSFKLWVRFGTLVPFCSPQTSEVWMSIPSETWHFNVFQCVKKSCGWLRNPAPHLGLGKPYINVINIDKPPITTGVSQAH